MELMLRPGDFAKDPGSVAGLSVGQLVRHWARTRPNDVAFATMESRSTWRDYDSLADSIASAVLETEVDSPVAIYLPDTMVFHAALCGASRAGSLAVGIGARSGVSEVAHLMTKAGCRKLITTRAAIEQSNGAWLDQLWSLGASPFSVICAQDTGDVETRTGGPSLYDAPRTPDRQRAVPDCAFNSEDVSMLNSTSGTTGLPKLVSQHEARWIAFAEKAVKAGHLTESDRVCCVIPAPFGFGLWTSHFAPALLGVSTAVMDRFSVDTMIDLIERERSTVLTCVSTQFKMLLNSERCKKADLSSLRVMFTGGEAVPYSESLAFEERTGAAVLQFYGSNESGAVSCTNLEDTADVRLRSCGHVIEDMHVKVFDSEKREVHGTVRRGQPAVKGPLMSQGYWNDPRANEELMTPEGWILLGDLVEIDESGVVKVVGRTADIIIRGGKNISAVEVEDNLCRHPTVSLAGVVGVPDVVFGEKLCAFVVTSGNYHLTQSELSGWLRSQGVTPEYIPEYVIPVESLPTSLGGKMAKGELRAIATQLLHEGSIS